MLEIITKSTEETLRLGTILGSLLQKGDVIGLFGDLGTGKTVFTQGIARGLKVEDYVTSPTFTLINEYSGSLPLFHFDVYRLDDPEELLELGYEEYFFGEGVTVIEWAEKIEDYLPPGYLAVNFSKTGDVQLDHRLLRFGPPKGKRYEGLMEELNNRVGSGD